VSIRMNKGEIQGRGGNYQGNERFPVQVIPAYILQKGGREEKRRFPRIRSRGQHGGLI